MPRVAVKKFFGIAPKLGDTILNGSQAQIAVNTKMWSQKLRPFSGLGPPQALSKLTGDIQAIYFYGGVTWLPWTQDVDVVRGAIANDALEKTYFTGTDKPRVTTNDTYLTGTSGTSTPPFSYILGIPAPSAPPVAADVAPGNITATSVWVHTFVRKYSDGTVEEGPPSSPSNSLTLASRQANVTLPNGTMANPADYGITHKRLYRSDGGKYFFVSESTFATVNAADSLATASLGSAITTTSYLPPPDGMQGIISMPNGCVAGFYQNVVYISEPYRPHAFPALNQYTVSHPIVALGNVGTAIVVGTSAFPWIGRGVDPAQYSFKPSPANLPCVSKRSMKGSELGAFYATSSGMAGFDGASVSVITKDFLTRDEWQAGFAPSTIHGAIYDGRYHGWYTTGLSADGTKVGGGFILDKTETAYLVKTDEYAYAAQAIPSTNELWLAKRNPDQGNLNYVYKWEADSTNPKIYDWKSKLFLTHGRENFACAQIMANFGAGLSPAAIAAILASIAAVKAANAALVDTSGPINGNASGFEINGGPLGGDNETQQAPTFSGTSGVITFRYFANGALKLERAVYGNEPFPMPAGFEAERHEFELLGAVEVTQVVLASSYEELAEV